MPIKGVETALTIEGLLLDYGYIALVMIMILDSCGVPWPTEATLVLTGAAASEGMIHPLLAAAAALIGAAAGSSLSYYLGMRLGPKLMQRIGAFFRLTPARLEKVDTWFARHGHRAVFFGRLIPFVRCFTGFPAGVVRMPFGKYLTYTLAGYIVYISISMGLGYGGHSLAKWLGDLEIALWILVPIALLVSWLKWGRQMMHKQKGTGL